MQIGKWWTWAVSLHLHTLQFTTRDDINGQMIANVHLTPDQVKVIETNLPREILTDDGIQYLNFPMLHQAIDVLDSHGINVPRTFRAFYHVSRELASETTLTK